ncbi:PIG-L deacetylase family protein [Bowdeniella nasicola]|nr:PIG-L family deacetylase [Bowdeniella nasicola]
MTSNTPQLTPLAMLENARCVMFAHAHPDDESLATGALIAHLAGRGVRCVLVTATRGERGEIRPGITDERPLIEIREDELDAACAALGVADRAFLGQGYRDSGMRWLAPGLAGPAADADPGSFTARPAADAQADLVELIDAFSPDALVSYDDAGTYGHPDHVHLHHVAKAAAASAHVPFIEICSDTNDPSWVDLPKTVGAIRAALASYASQLEIVGETAPRPGIQVRHVGGQLQDVHAGVALR